MKSADGNHCVALRIALGTDDFQAGTELVCRIHRLLAVSPGAPAQLAPYVGKHQIAKQVVAKGNGVPVVAIFVVIVFFPVEHGAIINL